MNLPLSLLFLVGFIFRLQSSKLRNAGSVLGMVGRYKDKASSFVKCHSATLWVTSPHAGVVAALFPSPGGLQTS